MLFEKLQQKIAVWRRPFDAFSNFRILAENINDVIIRCGSDGTATYVSPSSMQMFGRTPAEMVGKKHLAFVMPEDRAVLLEVRNAHAQGQLTGLAIYRVVRKDGSVVWVESSGRTLGDPTSTKAELIIVMRDITERKTLELQLAQQAMTDGLTGLANRRAFDVALLKEWERARRGNARLSLLIADVDHFKSFNDRYGHLAGDDCLAAVAASIQSTARQVGNIAARYGGEEIAVIMPNAGSSGSQSASEDIRTAVQALRIPHTDNKAGGGFVTISIGVASAIGAAGATAKTPESLIHAADMALYKAKRNGRNRVEGGLLLTTNHTVDKVRAA